MGAGVAGKALGIPMDLFGVSWFGNVVAMLAFAVGSIVKGSLIPAWTAAVSVDGVVPTMITYLPHGAMIGAGLVSLVQAALVLSKKGKKIQEDTTSERTVSMNSMRKSLGLGFALYLGIALLLALITGIYSEMSVGKLVVWIVFAAFAAIASELVCGLSAMHSGWFPAMATALIFLMIGIMMGFPHMSLGILVAYTAATGPAFTDMATDLKAGWILRGRGANPEFEKAGRKQQFIAELVGYGVIDGKYLFFSGFVCSYSKNVHCYDLGGCKFRDCKVADYLGDSWCNSPNSWRTPSVGHPICHRLAYWKYP